MGKNTGAWPSWAPPSLVQIYEELSSAPDADWILPEYPDFLLLLTEHRRDYSAAFVGIGEKTKTLRIVQSLCIDTRMRIAWERLQKATDEAKTLQLDSLAMEWATDLQLLAAHVAMRTVRVLSGTKGDISRAEWARRFTKIAEHAKALADLLEENAGLDEDLNRFGNHYFPDDEWETVCSELAWESAGDDLKPWTADEEARSERRAEAVSNGLEPEPLTEEEIARDAEFEAELRDWTDWYRWKLHNALRFLSVSGALRNLHVGASRMAQAPPFASKGSDDERRLARLTWALSTLFVNTFRQPLDDVVATIAEVVTGQNVSPDSVKMRRRRVRDHYRRPLPDRA